MRETRSRLMIWIGWIAIAITAGVLIWVVATVDDWSRDWTTNHAELLADHPDEELRPVDLPASPDVVAEEIEKWVASEAAWQLVKSEKQRGSVVLHLTHTTRVVRFVDDVTVSISGTDQQSTVQAESQSRVGVGDLGQNPRNLKELTNALSALASSRSESRQDDR